MNKFSNSIYKILKNSFPDLQVQIKEDSEYLELDIPSMNNADIGGLVIQTTEDKSIWVRNYHPCSGYSVDTADELIDILEGVFEDKILWAIGHRGGEWIETTLCHSTDNLEKEKGVTYKILSWSGTLNNSFATD